MTSSLAEDGKVGFSGSAGSEDCAGEGTLRQEGDAVVVGRNDVTSLGVHASLDVAPNAIELELLGDDEV